MARPKKTKMPVPRKLTYEMRQKQLQQKEERVQEALIELRAKKTSLRKAAKVYRVSMGLLQSRLQGRIPLAESNKKKRRLNEAEEDVLSGYLLRKVAQHGPLRLAEVELKANAILSRADDSTSANFVGKRWSESFIKRRIELQLIKGKVTSMQKEVAMTSISSS